LGIITCGADRRILSVVKNISPTGALIEVANALEIPDEFNLVQAFNLAPGEFIRVDNNYKPQGQ
jgi:hypothetical protein